MTTLQGQESQELDKGQDRTTTKGGLFWMFVPLILLAVSSTGWLLMVSVAVDDPGFAVERDYYKKASNYDEVLRQAERNQRLAWKVQIKSFVRKNDRIAHLRLSVKDGQGHPLPQAQVSVVAFHNARAADLQELDLSPVGKGDYAVELQRPRLGLWELRVRVQQGDVFTQVLRSELAPSPPGGPPS